MDDLDQAPPVSSSADSAPRPPPPFQYQFVREPEDEDEDDDEEEEEEEEEDEDREELEVLERKPAAGLAAASPAPALGGAPAPPAAPERPAPAAASPSAPPDDDDEDDEPPARPPPPPPAAPPCPPAAPPRRGSAGPAVVDLLYWRDIKKTGVVFGASLFLLLSLTVFSIVSVTAYIALALLSVTISFRIYKGVIQAIQKSDEGHPFRAYLESEVAISEELVQKYSNSVLGHVNCTIKELRRLFLVDDLVDSLKFAVLMWVFTYVGALFNGLTLLILALISLFSVPVIYERHQAQIDHYLGLANKSVKDAMAKIQAKIPGLKRKAE
ncbi:reticulon-4 isoform 3-T3 [Ctenodactylus gundi]